MNRFFVLSLVSLSSLTAFAQNEEVVNDQSAIIDWKEDSTEILTYEDIIAVQQEATTRNVTEKHFIDVWGRRSYRNIGFNHSTMDPKDPISTGVASINGGRVPKFKTNWGVSVKVGRNYRLHKSPIANVLQFYIDYTPLDLNVNHFSIEDGGVSGYVYDSGQYPFPGDRDKSDLFYTPWNLEKYEANYGMSLGPSLTLAPFTYVANVPKLHYLKLNTYFHFGYHASVLFMVNKSSADANPSGSRHDEISNGIKMDWGHGFMWSWGISMSWKYIGIGYEHRAGTLKYKSISTDLYGSDTYKFNTTTNRIFLSIRLGK